MDHDVLQPGETVDQGEAAGWMDVTAAAAATAIIIIIAAHLLMRLICIFQQQTVSRFTL